MHVSMALNINNFDCHWWLKLLRATITLSIIVNVVFECAHKIHDLLWLSRYCRLIEGIISIIKIVTNLVAN